MVHGVDFRRFGMKVQAIGYNKLATGGQSEAVTKNGGLVAKGKLEVEKYIPKQGRTGTVHPLGPLQVVLHDL